MDYLELFRGWKNVVEHDAGTVIYSANDPADVLYVILDGEVELHVRNGLLAVECKGGIIGEMAMLESAKRNAVATAATDIRLAVIDRCEVRELLARSTDFSLQLMTVLTDRLRSLDNYISERFENRSQAAGGT